MSEIQRRSLDTPPLGLQEDVSPESMMEAEPRTEVSLEEYIKDREEQMRRIAAEVLRISGLPPEVSNSLAETILDVHREEWGGTEDPATRKAIEEMSVPTTPFEGEHTLAPAEDGIAQKGREEYKRGSSYFMGVVMRELNGEIPSLQVVPEESEE